MQNHQKDKGAIAAARMHVMGEAEKKLHEVHSPKAKANEEAVKKAAEHQLLLAREVLQFESVHADLVACTDKLHVCAEGSEGEEGACGEGRRGACGSGKALQACRRGAYGQGKEDEGGAYDQGAARGQGEEDHA